MMYNRMLSNIGEVEAMVKTNLMEEERFHEMLSEILGGGAE